SIDEDIVELPNSKRTKYVLQSPTKTHSVLVILVDSRERILVQREYSYPPNEIMWQLPGGAILMDESIEDAAKRELAEESGYTAKQVTNIGFFYVSNRKSNRKQYVLLCKNPVKAKAQPDDDEFIESRWITKTKLTKMIAAGEITSINMLA